jgi:hypothetical protein
VIDFEPASFKDPAGRVFYHDHSVYRTLSGTAREHLEAAERAGLIADLTSARLLVDGAIVEAREAGLDAAIVGSHVLRQRRIDFVSYPYEWSFEMLRDAALTTLRAANRALKSGFILKDATSFNILFDGTIPLLVDTPSLEPHVDGRPWAAYGQFCRCFLFPLVMAAHRDIRPQPLLRGSFGEVPAADAAKAFRLTDYRRPGVLKDVMLQAKLERSFENAGREVGRATATTAYPTALLAANLARLETLISKLQPTAKPSEWSNYNDECNYSAEDREAKRAFVDGVLTRRAFGRLVDAGCNIGSYSRMALGAGSAVVALDLDSRAIDRLFRTSSRTDRISPVVGNLLDPTPAMGWRLQERRSLLDRLHGDGFLALALIHHLRITGNVPLGAILDQLFDIAPEGVVEWVDKSDTQVQRMLSLRPDVYDDYNWASFDELLRQRAEVIAVTETHRGARRLCHVRLRQG